jgi:biotin-dependent carboxylase-like uncharacterized protein
MSSTITVEAPGFFTTVQDLGRPGYAHLGISLSGAADALALRIGNLLVGNDANAAALEMTAVGGTFRFERETVVAITGANCDVQTWQPFPARHVRVGAVTGGARAYLCVRGGIGVPLVLGSASSPVQLKRGRVLPIGDRTVRAPRRQGLRRPPERGNVVRVTAGPQADWFADGALYTSTYTVEPNSNRAGLRLTGAPVQQREPRQLLTEGVSLGAVQVPAGGQPIVLFVDQTTTGGYPKVANVITADLWRVGQFRPGDHLRFEPVTIEQALQLLREQEELVATLI